MLTRLIDLLGGYLNYLIGSTNMRDLQEYVDAYHLGYIKEFSRTSTECSDRGCEECPGQRLCEDLSNNGHYETYVENYKKENIYERIMPLLEQ